MSNYIFAPSPTFGISEHHFVTYPDAFNDEELGKMIDYLDLLKQQRATVGGTEENADIDGIRKSNVAWLTCNNESQWIYDRMAWVARLLNGQFYKFDLYGFFEDMQYTVYDGKEEGHYSWHQDSGTLSNNFPPRKFSLVLQLTDPSEYEGGDLELLTNANPTIVKKQKGLVSAFPSYMLHRVTPVTSGIRKTLVAWVCGPSFR